MLDVSLKQTTKGSFRIQGSYALFTFIIFSVCLVQLLFHFLINTFLPVTQWKIFSILSFYSPFNASIRIHYCLPLCTFIPATLTHQTFFFESFILFSFIFIRNHTKLFYHNNHHIQPWSIVVLVQYFGQGLPGWIQGFQSNLPWWQAITGRWMGKSFPSPFVHSTVWHTRLVRCL